MRLLHKFVLPAVLALVATASVAAPAGATVRHRHHASRHRHDGYSGVVGHGAVPNYAPPGYVAAGRLRPEGPQGTGLLGHGGVFGTGYSNGTGLFGIGFFGL